MLNVCDQREIVQYFRLNAGAPMSELIGNYCKHYDLHISRARFMLEGERILAEDTAESLGLKDYDSIDAAMELTGSSTAAVHRRRKEEEKIVKRLDRATSAHRARVQPPAEPRSHLKHHDTIDVIVSSSAELPVAPSPPTHAASSGVVRAP